MKQTKGKWFVRKARYNANLSKCSVMVKGKTRDLMIARCGFNDANANLIASAPEMLELLKDILAEVRPEISRVNEAAGETIFNPVATETIDMAKELIAKAGGVE